MHKSLLKLAKMILNLAQVDTKEGKTLISEGALEIGSEVFVEDENGELAPAEDGEYNTEENVIVIADGKVAEIREIAKEENEPEQESEAEPIQEAEEPEAEPDERDNRIAELEAQVAELNNIIVEKDEEIGRLRAELEKSDVKPAEEQLKSQKPEKTKFQIHFV